MCFEIKEFGQQQPYQITQTRRGENRGEEESIETQVSRRGPVTRTSRLCDVPLYSFFSMNHEAIKPIYPQSTHAHCLPPGYITNNIGGLCCVVATISGLTFFGKLNTHLHEKNGTSHFFSSSLTRFYQKCTKHFAHRPITTCLGRCTCKKSRRCAFDRFILFYPSRGVSPISAQKSEIRYEFRILYRCRMVSGAASRRKLACRANVGMSRPCFE